MSTWRWPVLVLLLVAAAALGLTIGTMRVPLSGIWDALRGIGEPGTMMVVRNLRLPRVTVAILVGAGLGLSGAALQGTMRNPLAEPYLLGVSGGAAVGAVIASAMGVAAALLPLAAFAGAIVAVLAAVFVARATG